MAKQKTLDGQWEPVPVEGIYVECCGCGLTHEIDFKIQWRWKRNEKQTATARQRRTIDDFPIKKKRKRRSKNV